MLCIFYALTSNGVNVYAKKSSFSSSGLIAKGIILVLVLVFLNIFANPIRNYFYTVSSSLNSAFVQSGKGISTFFGSFFHFRDTKIENEALKKENQNLLSQIALFQQLLGQDRAIHQMQENNPSKDFNAVLTKVVGLNTQNDTLLVNQGRDSGVSENMPIISSEKVLYGRVIKVYDSFSEVMLISSKNSIVDVKIQTNDIGLAPVHGAVKGQGSGKLGLDTVSSDAQIKEGEFLVTSGLEGMFPQNLLVGKITSVNVNDLQPFQTAKIQSFLDFKNIENLFLIIDYKKR